MSTLDLDQLSDYLDGDQNEHGLDFAPLMVFCVRLQLVRSSIAG